MVSNQVRRPSMRKCSSEQRAVQALDDAVALRTADLRGLVSDVLELEEQLIGMAVRPAPELAAVVAEHGVDRGAVGLERR